MIPENVRQDPSPGGEDVEGLSLGETVREVSQGLRDLVRGEIHLAKAEFQSGFQDLRRQAFVAGLFGAIAALGIFPLMSFLVVGLGKILGDNYWLSSLIVGVVFVAVGAGMAARAYSKMKQQDLSMPETRDSLDHEREFLASKVQDIASRRRAS